jgi:hypothetical protein
MNYDEILTVLGLTQVRLEAIIIFTAIALCVGTVAYHAWKILLAGGFALMILFVFAHHEDTVAKSNDVVQEKVMEVKVDSEHDRYVKDCMSLTGKQGLCEELWNDQNQ